MLPPLQDLTAFDLQRFINGSLSLRTAEGNTHVLSLHEVRGLGSRYAGSARDPFALSLRGPSGLRLPQGMYTFEFPEAAGSLEFFISQTADNAEGSWFEAVFT